MIFLASLIIFYKTCFYNIVFFFFFTSGPFITLRKKNYTCLKKMPFLFYFFCFSYVRNPHFKLRFVRNEKFLAYIETGEDFGFVFLFGCVRVFFFPIWVFLFNSQEIFSGFA